jgi:hypothetical protein
MEEFSILSEGVRAPMIFSLVEAEADAKAGRGTPFEPEAFIDDTMARRARLATKKALCVIRYS